MRFEQYRYILRHVLFLSYENIFWALVTEKLCCVTMLIKMTFLSEHFKWWPKSKNQYRYCISFLCVTSIQIKWINITALKAMNVTRLLIWNHTGSYISVNKQKWLHECSVFWRFVILLQSFEKQKQLDWPYKKMKYVYSMSSWYLLHKS